MTSDDEAKLIDRAKDGDTGARDAIISRHLATAEAAVRSVARRATDDDIGYGQLALVAAFDDFDPSKGVPFAAFVRQRVAFDARDRRRKAARQSRLAKLVREADCGDDGGSPIEAIVDKGENHHAAVWAEVANLRRRLIRAGMELAAVQAGVFDSERLSASEVAELCGRSPAAEAKRTYRARREIARRVNFDDLLE
jgi:DNA-directed RNA polymerase specialized sigma24 family protein